MIALAYFDSFYLFWFIGAIFFGIYGDFIWLVWFYINSLPFWNVVKGFLAVWFNVYWTTFGFRTGANLEDYESSKYWCLGDLFNKFWYSLFFKAYCCWLFYILLLSDRTVSYF